MWDEKKKRVQHRRRRGKLATGELQYTSVRRKGSTDRLRRGYAKGYSNELTHFNKNFCDRRFLPVSLTNQNSHSDMFVEKKRKKKKMVWKNESKNKMRQCENMKKAKRKKSDGMKYKLNIPQKRKYLCVLVIMYLRSHFIFQEMSQKNAEDTQGLVLAWKYRNLLFPKL